MIALVRGRIVSLRPPASAQEAARVVVDVGGVGYLAYVPSGAVARLPGIGEEVVLHTSLQVREDAMTLYGFADVESRDLFELVITASGVGPKIALAALSTHAARSLARAIVDGDLDALALVPGVGKKLAQRIVLELKEKLGGLEAELEPVGAPGETTARSEARLALLELGYSPAEARDALAAVDGDPEDVAGIVRAALRSLAGVRAGGGEE